jgi:hypothetical protein
MGYRLTRSPKKESHPARKGIAVPTANLTTDQGTNRETIIKQASDWMVPVGSWGWATMGPLDILPLKIYTITQIHLMERR